MRTLLILAAGVAAGYLYGSRDAPTHVRPLQRRVAERLVSRAGGASRSRVGSDVDAQMRRLER